MFLLINQSVSLNVQVNKLITNGMTKKTKETNKMHGWGCPIHDATGLPCYSKKT